MAKVPYIQIWVSVDEAAQILAGLESIDAQLTQEIIYHQCHSQICDDECEVKTLGLRMLKIRGDEMMEIKQ